MTALRDQEWEYFRGYISKGVALSVSEQLQGDGVPNRIEARALESGIEAEYWIVVQCSLAHRARWIRAQLPPEESELDYLATKRLGGEE